MQISGDVVDLDLGQPEGSEAGFLHPASAVSAPSSCIAAADRCDPRQHRATESVADERNGGRQPRHRLTFARIDRTRCRSRPTSFRSTGPKPSPTRSTGRDRLIEYSNKNADGITGLCLEINDLWRTKLAAGRPKDFEFCRAVVRAKPITRDIVRSRTSTIDPRIDADELATRVERLLGEVGSK